MDHKGKFDKIDKEVLINYWQKEYEDGKKKFGHGRQGHGAIKYTSPSFPPPLSFIRWSLVTSSNGWSSVVDDLYDVLCLFLF